MAESQSGTVSHVFISHTSQDKALADALSKAFDDLFGEQVKVCYSTAKEQDAGIRPGADWFKWIVDQVQVSKVALVLLTTASIQKPWIPWEAGAVFGSALSGDKRNARRVCPIIYRPVTSNLAPSPFHAMQIVRGDVQEDVRQLFASFIGDFKIPVQRALQIGERLGSTIAKYLESIENALLNAPLYPTEDAIQEWCVRLDNLKAQNRMSEVDHMHDWLNIAFGREGDDGPRPFDLRIHRRLGELYLGAKHYEKAVAEFELARQLAPRDIFILRRLGQAYLGQKAYDKTKAVIDRIAELDADAFRHNVECATLRGRWYREQKNYTEARKVYEEAFWANPDSYYLANLVGEMRLESGDHAGAVDIYHDVLRIINEQNEWNVWAHATAANASIVTGHEDVALRHLRDIREGKDIHGERPTVENLRTIEDGLARLGKSLAKDNATLARWCQALRGS
jgi:tetratricopeptide (TPR) repeat protein